METRSVQRQRRTSRADQRVSSLGRHTCNCVCAEDGPSEYMKLEGLTEVMGEHVSNSFPPKKKKGVKLDKIAQMNRDVAREINQRRTTNWQALVPEGAMGL